MQSIAQKNATMLILQVEFYGVIKTYTKRFPQSRLYKSTYQQLCLIGSERLI